MNDVVIRTDKLTKTGLTGTTRCMPCAVWT
jgi:hypothetical protein